MKLKYSQQKVDVDKIVRGYDLDLESYSNKFKVWDYVVENNFMISSDEKEFEFAKRLLNDPTIFIYAYFRDPERGTPFKLTSYQDLIINRALKHDFTFKHPERFLLYRAANQMGKSALLDLMAIYVVLKYPSRNVVMVSKSLPQSQFLMTSIKSFLNNSSFSDSWKEEIGEINNTTHLTFTRDVKDATGKKIGETTSRILCVPAGEGALGYPVHHMFLDEADFYEDAKRFFWKVAYPRTNKTKGQIILFTNPNPDIARDSSLLWELWQGTLFKRKFHFSFLDAPWNTQEDLDIAQANSPSYIFQSTHLGEFPQDGGSFFTQREIERMFSKSIDNQLPILNEPVYIGLDIAKVKDQTVLSLGVLKDNEFNPSVRNLEVRYLRAFPTGTDYNVVLDELERIYNHYKVYGGVSRIGFDSTGVGGAVSDFAKARGIGVVDVKFSIQSKGKLYGNFKLLAEQNRIFICNSSPCKTQLSNVVFKKTASGQMTMSHDKESTHDDYPDSIAVLIDISVAPSKVPVTITQVIPMEPEEKTDEERTKELQDQKEKDLNNYYAEVINNNKPVVYGGNTPYN